MKFKAILRKVILENMEKVDFLIDTYTKPKKKEDGTIKKPKMSVKELAALIAADPKSILNDIDIESATAKELKDVKAGGYTPWIIKSYLNLNQQTEVPFGSLGYDREVKMLKERFLEDLYKLKNDLQKFIRFRERIPVEKRESAFKKGFTPDDLYDLVKDFSLEKTKASKEEKEKAKETYEHPGAEIVFRGSDWTVAKISDKGDLGFDAAQFYGGYHLEVPKGETRWCTSSPGLKSWFDRYIKEGPLYVIIPTTWSGKRGERTQLPAERYQFHFPSNQFMDPDDRQQDLVKFLAPGGKMEELREFFKPEFAKGLTIEGGEKFSIESFTGGPVGKFIALYGLDELIENLPKNLKAFIIQNRDTNSQIIVNIPESLGDFENLEMILLDNCIDSLPNSICNLKKLKFLALMNNPKLTKLPDCIVDLPSLFFLNLKGSENVEVPQKIKDNYDEMAPNIWDLHRED